MKKYRILSILFVIVFLGGALFNFIRQSTKDDLTKELEARKLVLPEAERFSPKFSNPAHYKAYKINPQTGQEEFIGVVFVTTDLFPNIRGYAGPIKTAVGIGLDGRINAVHVISHSETPSYVFNLNQFISQFPGKDTNSVFRLGKDIDGITRATMSSEAITRSVEKSLKVIAKDVLNLEVITGPDVEPRHLDIDQVMVPLLIFGVAILGIILSSNALRWTALLGGLFYLGLIKSTMVSVVQIANIGLFKVPEFTSNPLWYFLVGLTLVSGLALGMVYCGSLCPFAAVQESLYAASRKIRFKTLTWTRKIDKGARCIKYGLLLVVLIASFIVGDASAANIEPFLTLFTTHGTSLAWILLMLLLIISLFHFRFWCKYLCPVGAACGLLARISIFKIKLGEGCGGCQVCEKVCPVEAIHMDATDRPVIDYSECILCGKCMKKCPKGILSLGGSK